LIAFLVPCAQAKVADLQEAIHARSKWTRLLALIYSTCSHLLQFLYSFCTLKCSVLRKKSACSRVVNGHGCLLRASQSVPLPSTNLCDLTTLVALVIFAGSRGSTFMLLQ